VRCVICNAEIQDDLAYCPRCGAIQTRYGSGHDAPDPLLGKVIAGKFELTELLGIGGMGKVFKATDARDGEPVVVKILHDHLAVDRKLVLRFRREWRAIRRIDHPNVIRVLDFGQDEEARAFIAMEYVDGTDLTVMFNAEEMPDEERVIRIGVQVCEALAEAHARKVLHRDLKPENIMISESGGRHDFVKVLDFGIAKIQDPEDQTGVTLTRAGEAFGTFEYMSPEQARCKPLDPRSDVYQFGIMLYELTTGELPFTAETPLEIISKLLREEPAPPSQTERGHSISPELEAIILKAIEKKPKDRFRDAAAMADALRELLPDAPPPPPRTAKPLTRAIQGAGKRLTMAGMAVSEPIGRVPLLSRIVPVSRGGRAALGIGLLALVGGVIALVLLWPRGDFPEVRDALDQGRALRALNLLGQHPGRASPEGQALKARALLLKRKPEPTKAWRLLKAATGKDSELLDDDEVVADLIATLDRSRAGSTIALLTGERLGLRIVPELTEASRGERYWLRWNAIRALRKIGAGDRVDEGWAYILDLRFARSCGTRKRAARKLGEMGEQRAMKYLIEATERPAADNRCMDLTLDRALWAIEKKGRQ